MSGAGRGRWLPSLTLLLATVLVTLAALELGFRLARLPVGTVQINRGTIRRSPNPRLGFELRPRAVAVAEVEYRINAAGLRGPEVEEEKPPGRTRVAVLGDSITFGYWVADEDTFPRQMERLLSAGRPSGDRVDVLNFGVPGYNLDQDLEVLRTRALRFAPDAVVVALCLNDLESVFSYEYGLTVDRSARRESVAGRVADALLQQSRLFAWIEYRLAEREARKAFVRTRNPMPGPLYAEAVSQQRAELVARFGTLAILLREAGVPGLVAVFPTFGERFDRYPHRGLHEAAVEAARGAGLVAVDLLDCYSAYDLRAARVDVVHPSPLGHRVAAHAIVEAMCADGLPCPPARPPGGCGDYRPADFAVVKGY